MIKYSGVDESSEFPDEEFLVGIFMGIFRLSINDITSKGQQPDYSQGIACFFHTLAAI